MSSYRAELGCTQETHCFVQCRGSGSDALHGRVLVEKLDVFFWETDAYFHTSILLCLLPR